MKVGPDGTARVSFDVPAFNGSARVMAVAWTKSQVGQASSDVFIRDPVVAQATLPRFLAIGDRSRFHVEINNVEGDAGDYNLDVDVRGPVTVAAEAARRTIRLTKGQKAQVTIPVTAAGLGTASFGLRLTGGGHDLAQELRVKVLPSSQAVADRNVRPLPAGGSITLSQDLLADMLPGSGAVSVSVSPFAALDVASLLKALDRYPYGCTEQTVSRALPLLYVNRLAAMEHLALDEAAESRVQAAIDKVLTRQGSNGSFGLWSVGGDDLWLDAFVTDFLTRAREAGRQVPTVAYNLALDRLRNQVVNTGSIRAEEASGVAYALYVLARNGRPIMGDLRYLADNKLGDFGSPMAKGHLAAALALLGDRGRSRTRDGRGCDKARERTRRRPVTARLWHEAARRLRPPRAAGRDRRRARRPRPGLDRSRERAQRRPLHLDPGADLDGDGGPGAGQGGRELPARGRRHAPHRRAEPHLARGRPRGEADHHPEPGAGRGPRRDLGLGRADRPTAGAGARLQGRALDLDDEGPADQLRQAEAERALRRASEDERAEGGLRPAPRRRSPAGRRRDREPEPLGRRLDRGLAFTKADLSPVHLDRGTTASWRASIATPARSPSSASPTSSAL